MNQKQLTIKLPEALADQLKDTAERIGTTQTRIIEEALKKELLRLANKSIFE
jgi:predicted transcriptional regulator